MNKPKRTDPNMKLKSMSTPEQPAIHGRIFYANYAVDDGNTFQCMKTEDALKTFVEATLAQIIEWFCSEGEESIPKHDGFLVKAQKQMCAFFANAEVGDVFVLRTPIHPTKMFPYASCNMKLATLMCLKAQPYSDKVKSDPSAIEQPPAPASSNTEQPPTIAELLVQEVNSDFVQSVDYAGIIAEIKSKSREESVVTLEKYKILGHYTQAQLRWIEASLVRDGFTVDVENVSGMMAIHEDIYRIKVSGWIKP